MHLRRCGKRKTSDGGKVYWELVGSVRTERGPRQRIVAYLGPASEPALDGILLQSSA